MRSTVVVTHGLTWFLIPATLAALVLVQAWLFRRDTCETFDEFTYLWLGVSIFRRGNFFNLCSPMTPPLPILLEYWLPTLTTRALPETPSWVMAVPGLIRQARLLTSITVGVPLAWTVYAWLWVRRGWVLGAIAGGLVALSPSVLASVSIATTDACFALFGVLALAALHRYQTRPGLVSFVNAGLALGLALASKQSALILFPVAGVVLLGTAPERKAGSTRIDRALFLLSRAGFGLTALVSIAFVVDWALYGFQFGPRLGSMDAHAFIPVFVPMILQLFPDGDSIMAALQQCRAPIALDTLIGQIDHARDGHQAFLMGERSFRGWWSFFPIALALKSTPAELVLFATSAALAVWPKTWRDPLRRLWLLTLLVLIGSGMWSAINIGQRYMLLAYPLVILIAIDAFGGLPIRRAWLIGGALLAWQSYSAFAIAPHYLSYFNSLCGGPEQGYRYLVDSSLDWGQDLPGLRRELEARGYRKVALAYFGSASPLAYGLRSMECQASQDPVEAGCDYLAISCTTLQGAYSDSSVWIDHFDHLPSTRVAHSLFLYNLRDPGVHEALTEVRRTLRESRSNRSHR